MVFSEIFSSLETQGCQMTRGEVITLRRKGNPLFWSTGACYRFSQAGSLSYKCPLFGVRELATVLYRLEARLTSVFFLEYGSLLPFFTGWKPILQVFSFWSTGACVRSLQAGSPSYKCFLFGVRELATVFHRLEARLTSVLFLEYGSLLPFFTGWKPVLQVFSFWSTGACYRSSQAGSLSYKCPLFGVRELATVLYRLEAYLTRCWLKV
jgi:hypothetical protein